MELKGTHFVVYFTSDKNFAKEVLSRAEKYYNTVADNLGYARYSQFWQWDNRVKIYIYPDRTSYLGSGSYPKWSEGMALYAEKTVLTFAGSRDFVNAILPHEITHLIFRDFVGTGQENIPLWLDEGVAQWEEPEKRAIIKPAIKYIYEHSQLIPLETFMHMNVKEQKDEGYVRNYYIQAMSLVDFLINKHGTDDFIHFCRNLRDGKDIEAALQFAYPTSIRSVKDLEIEWIKYIEKL